MRTGPAERLAALVSRLPPAALAAVAAAAIAVTVVLGALQRSVYPGWLWANLDSESSFGLWVAAALLWTASVLWLLVFQTGRSGTRWTAVWAAALAWLALDEGNAVHERLERWSGIDWQVLYMPVIAIAGLAWWMVVRRRGDGRQITAAMAAGAAAWAAALLLELIQNWGGEPVRASIYDPTMVAEEGLEMAGAALFALAGLLTLRRPLAAERPPAR